MRWLTDCGTAGCAVWGEHVRSPWNLLPLGLMAGSLRPLPSCLPLKLHPGVSSVGVEGSLLMPLRPPYARSRPPPSSADFYRASSNACLLIIPWRGRLYQRFTEGPLVPISPSWFFISPRQAWVSAEGSQHHILHADSSISTTASCDGKSAAEGMKAGWKWRQACLKGVIQGLSSSSRMPSRGFWWHNRFYGEIYLEERIKIGPGDF